VKGKESTWILHHYAPGLFCLSNSITQPCKCGRYYNIHNEMPWRCGALLNSCISLWYKHLFALFSIKLADKCANDTESITNRAGSAFFIYQPIITKEQVQIPEMQIFPHQKTTSNNVSIYSTYKTTSNFNFFSPNCFISDTQGVSGTIFHTSGVRSWG